MPIVADKASQLSSDTPAGSAAPAPAAAEKPVRKTQRRTTRRKSTSRKKSASAPRKAKERIFALDIGTRSVIGIVAEREADGQLKIIATDRLEHKTRAMLDGQIHDVPQVASIISTVRKMLEKKVGRLHNAAVAAAGRALYTMTAEAEMDVSGIITAEQQRNLDFAGVQAAQAKLVSSHTVDDPTRYYCVGYSTIRYVLDDSDLRMLVGQRGQKAKAIVIATFLPRQVIDSMQSALHAAGLEMRALTLEPIAAINVLIPVTMRHLNLVLVDIGAGTSDVAITRNGAVVAYGMVPLAGDEITEAISQHFLLDFNVAERIKRQAAKGESVEFTDILGTPCQLTAEQVLEPVMPSIKKLAEAIVKQIIELNSDAPQAVMLVGGGSLTPKLAEFVADALEMPANRVAVRHPDNVDGVEKLPDVLKLPDAVTPLGILKIASINTLHFFSVYVNGAEYSLFNFRELTVSDALLNAGLNMRKFNGRPGLGLMVTIGQEKKFFPGTLGTLAQITVDGEKADLDTPIHDGSHIKIVAGENGQTPEVRLGDIVSKEPDYRIYINGHEKFLTEYITVNGEEKDAGYLLQDDDHIEKRAFKSLGEALLAAGYPPQGRHLKYKLNGEDATYTATPDLLLNDAPASISMPVHEGDHIEYHAEEEPTLGDILHITERDTSLTIYYDGGEYAIPSAAVELKMNGRAASTGTVMTEGADVVYHRSDRQATMVSEALLAVGFEPPAPSSHMTVSILVNGRPVDFTDPIKNGDTLDIVLQPMEYGKKADSSAAAPAPQAATGAAETTVPAHGIPGLASAISSSQNNTSSQPASTAVAPGRRSIFDRTPSDQPAGRPSSGVPTLQDINNGAYSQPTRKKLSISDFIHKD